jgi:hypothetical protein|tara:strand:- start:133 stop:453 length:321 start_codon:yes stop_codon:yes gene_type:complete
VTDPLFEILNPKTDWYIVLRPFDGDVKHLRGEVVNTKEWIHKSSLVDARFIAALPHGVDLPTEGKDGRRFLDLDDEQKEKLPVTKVVAERPDPQPSDRKTKTTKVS